jgi:hypothetical protein
MNVTLTNSGNAALNLGTVTVGGTTTTPDFALASGTTCTPQLSLAPNSSCVIAVTFTPSAVGTRTATVTITDDATPRTQTIPLSGIGVTGGDFTVTPPSGTVTVTNGQTVKFPIIITPGPGSSSSFTFSAPGPIPVGMCVFYPQPNPATITSTQSFNFLVTTNDPQQGTVAPIISPIPIAPTSGQRLVQLLLAVCVLALVFALDARRLRPRMFLWPRVAVLLPTLLLLFGALTFVGCGGGGNALVRNASSTSSSQTRGITQPGTYPITITVTTGTATHSTTVTIQVQ